LSERETPARTQSAETLTRELRCIVRSGDNPLFLEDVSNGGGIKAEKAHAAKDVHRIPHTCDIDFACGEE